MGVKQELVESLRQNQAESDRARTEAEVLEAAKQELERRDARLRESINAAKAVADGLSLHSGSHVYLGGDALTRDYHSDWYNFAPLNDENGTVIQLALEKTERVIRHAGVELGAEFDSIDVKMRLHDVNRGVSSTADASAVRYSRRDGISISGDGEHVQVDPDDPVLDELDEIMNVFPQLESTGESSF